MTGRATSPCGTKTFRAAGALCVAAMFCASACADIWGFDDLRGGPDGGGSLAVTAGEGGSRTGGTGTGGYLGGVAGRGAGGSVSPESTGGATGRVSDPADAGGTSPSGGTSGQAGANGAGGSSGRGGASGGGGGGSGGVVGVGGRVGAAGSGGAAGRAGSGGTGTGSGVGGRGTGGTTGSGGGAGGTGVCASGANRCVGGDLQTCSATGIWQSTGTATRQLLANPNFEAGVTGWTISVAGGFPLIYVATGRGSDAPAVAAQSPPNVAWFGGYDRADDIGSQSVVIPADATSINLSFYYAIFTRQNGNAESDVMDVTVTVGAQTTAVAHFSNANSVATWTRFSAALPTTLAGQTMRLQFRAVTNGSQITSFYVDTVAVQVVACP